MKSHPTDGQSTEPGWDRSSSPTQWLWPGPRPSSTAVSERITLVAETQAPVVVIEAIKLLEARLSLRLCDQVWVVTALRSDKSNG